MVMRRREYHNTTGSERFDTIAVTHHLYNSFSYVLLLLHGTDKWHLGLRLRPSPSLRFQSSHMNPHLFYAYKLFRQLSQLNTILRDSRHFYE